MKVSKRILPRFAGFLAFLALFLFGTISCTIDNLDNGSLPLSENELRIAGQIIGESVSESENGVLSNFPEAFAIPDQNGLQQGLTFFSLRPIENLQNYTYQYEPTSGRHTVEYTREQAVFNQIVTTDVSLNYIFRDGNGNILENPVSRADEIESVEFFSMKSGRIETPDKLSIFSRNDQFFIDGLSETSPNLLIDGIHSGEGFFSRVQTAGNRLEREYILDMNFLNVSINKNAVQTNRNFRTGVNGALSYESTIREGQSGSGGTKIVNGTLEFTGDGTALLKFRNFFDVFRVRLDQGTVFDDDEFEGRVTQVDLSQSIIQLANGQRIRITPETLIEDGGDYFSLSEVANALTESVRIEAEGEYIKDQGSTNLWTAQTVEFEEESNQFEEQVVSVNLTENSFTVQSGDVFILTEASVIENDGDFLTLEEVQNAVASGVPVFADGDFQSDNESGSLIVDQVEFTFNVQQIEENITSVNPAAQTFTVVSGKVIQITEETETDFKDFSDLEGINTALSSGAVVEADASIYFDAGADLWIAVNVEFDQKSDSGDDGSDD
ncbi:MAG: DUF5666 domain-containing protein [Balneolaceae bacterium]|nr:DUF5666 domain-containing protein [Balneolaceae bacterium]